MFISENRRLHLSTWACVEKNIVKNGYFGGKITVDDAILDIAFWELIELYL